MCLGEPRGSYLDLRCKRMIKETIRLREALLYTTVLNIWPSPMRMAKFRFQPLRDTNTVSDIFGSEGRSASRAQFSSTDATKSHHHPPSLLDKLLPRRLEVSSSSEEMLCRCYSENVVGYP